MQRNILILFAAVAIVCGLALSGCGKKIVYVPVEGTLTLDGSPYEGATVSFTPKDGNLGMSAGGVTDASGHFVVTTGVEQGCTPGDYDVTVFHIENSGDSAITAKSKNIFPAKFADPAQAGLSVKVEKKMEPLKFDLEK